MNSYILEKVNWYEIIINWNRLFVLKFIVYWKKDKCVFNLVFCLNVVRGSLIWYYISFKLICCIFFDYVRYYFESGCLFGW